MSISSRYNLNKTIVFKYTDLSLRDESLKILISNKVFTKLATLLSIVEIIVCNNINHTSVK